IRADERLTPSSSPKSMRSFQAGWRASGKSSTATTRPTRMSTARKSSKEISARGRGLARLVLVLVLAGRLVRGRRRRAAALLLVRRRLLLVGRRRLGRRRLVRRRGLVDPLTPADRLALAAVLRRKDGRVGLLLRGRRGRRRGGRRGLGGRRRGRLGLLGGGLGLVVLLVGGLVLVGHLLRRGHDDRLRDDVRRRGGPDRRGPRHRRLR